MANSSPRRHTAALGRTFAAVLLLMLAAGGAMAQSTNPASSTTSAMTPTGMSPGSPAGTYALSGFDDVNLFNGNLNFRLPLLTVGGRGTAGYTMTLATSTKKWQVKTDPGQDSNGPGGPISDRFTPQWKQWNTMLVDYGPGVMQGRKTGVGTVVRKTCDTCAVSCNRVAPLYRYTLTRLTFISPDGTEYELRDEATNGEPKPVEQARCGDTSNVGAARGRRFVSTDGSAMTFVSDEDIYDDVRVSTSSLGSWVFNPSGVLYMRDGTAYRVNNGAVSWIRDRNGNQVTFYYGTTTEITDSLGRKVTIEYDLTEEPYGKHDRITYSGFGGAQRVIRISKSPLSGALRDPYTAKTTAQLFPELNGAATQTAPFDPEVVSAVWLPDNRKYQVYYNSYAEVARVELPTGGATEYDMKDGSGVIASSGATASGVQEKQVYRRLKMSRVYTGLTADTLVSRMVYTAGDGTNEYNGTTLTDDHVVTAEQADASNRLLSLSRHYFAGSAAESLFTREEGSLYSPAGEGRETTVVSLDTTDVNKALRTVTNTWEQREGVAWVGHLESWGSNFPPPGLSIEPDNDPRLTRVATTLDDGQVTKEEFDYDRYNNRKEVRDYAYGQGQTGALLRRMVTEYLTTNPVNGVDYVGSSSGIHLRSLPLNKYVYAGASTIPVAKTSFEYDNYTPDQAAGNRHAALTPRASISGLCTFYDAAGNCFGPDDINHPPASYTTRGNLTGTTQYLLADDGTATGSITTSLQYDVAGNLVKAIDPRSTAQTTYATAIEYDDNFGAPDGEARVNSTPAELSTSQGSQVTYAFPTRLTNTMGQVIRCQYDYHTGHAVDGEDANGVVSSGFYEDVLDRPTRLVAAANVAALRRQTVFSYDDTGRVTTTKSDLNTYQDGVLKSEALYDGLGRTVEARRYESATEYIATLTHYDGLGRVSEVSNPYRPKAVPAESPVWTTSEYDALGRAWRVTTPDGAKVVTAYSGAQVLVTDQAGRRRMSETDALGRLVKVWEVTGQDADTVPLTLPGGEQAYGYLTGYGYDVLGNLREAAQGGQHRYFAYDSLSRLVRARNPEQSAFSATAEFPALTDPLTGYGQWSMGYAYDEAGNLKKRMDARGVVTTNVYDGLGRVTSRTYSDATPSVSYFYDSQALPGGAPTFERGLSVGRLVAVTYGGAASTAGSYLGGYDALGRAKLSRQVTDTGTAEGLKTYEMAYEYDLPGNLKSETYPSGRVAATEYDAAGRVAGVMNQATGAYYAGGAATDATNRIGYSSHGAASNVRLGNGLWEHTLYNNRLQPYRIGLGTSASDSSVLKLDYTYGEVVNAALDATKNNGNVQSQTITVPGASAPFAQSYVYDALNRLKSAEEKSGAATTWRQVYSYDRYGNRGFAAGTTSPDYSQTPNDSATGLPVDPVRNPVYDQSNNQVKVTTTGQSDYGYDTAGNLLCDPAHKCVQSPQFTPYYSYDADNEMIGAGGSPASGGAGYFYDGEGQRVKKVARNITTVFVHDVEGRLVAEYGGEQPQAGGTGYVTQDSLGSTRVVTGSGQEVRGRYDYMPFGEETYAGRQGYGGGDVSRRFTGKERDGETGLDYFLARYYSSNVGRFSSADPVFLKRERLSDPQRLNLFTYARNNPLLYVDPTGEDIHVKITDDVIGQTTIRSRTSSEIKAARAAHKEKGETRPAFREVTVNVYRVVVTNDSGGSFTFGVTRDTLHDNADGTHDSPARGNYGTNGEAPPGSYSGNWIQSDTTGLSLRIHDSDDKTESKMSGPDGDRYAVQVHAGNCSEGCPLVRDTTIQDVKDQMDGLQQQDRKNGKGTDIHVDIEDRNNPTDNFHVPETDSGTMIIKLSSPPPATQNRRP
jgi:RHS repeat-associated protein